MTETKRLYRSRQDRMLAGVCAGLGAYLGVDPTIVRILWVILSIFPGSLIGGVIAYVVLALIIPEEPAPGATASGAPVTGTQPPGP
jgi:phage shock protein C